MATVLIVDDVKTDRELLGRIVSQQGHTPVYATDGDEVPAAVSSAKPKLVLLDVVMPNTNGYSACRAIKANPETKSTPVVFVTSKATASDKFWAQKQGADDVIGKPFTTDTIQSVLKRFL